jgi:hypothetical protein
MLKHRAEQQIRSCRNKISRQSGKLRAGRSRVVGADLGIAASAAQLADAGAPAASYALFDELNEKPRGRLSWRPLSFQTEHPRSAIGT